MVVKIWVWDPPNHPSPPPPYDKSRNGAVGHFLEPTMGNQLASWFPNLILNCPYGPQRLLRSMWKLSNIHNCPLLPLLHPWRMLILIAVGERGSFTWAILVALPLRVCAGGVQIDVALSSQLLVLSRHVHDASVLFSNT